MSIVRTTISIEWINPLGLEVGTPKTRGRMVSGLSDTNEINEQVSILIRTLVVPYRITYRREVHIRKVRDKHRHRHWDTDQSMGTTLVLKRRITRWSYVWDFTGLSLVLKYISLWRWHRWPCPYSEKPGSLGFKHLWPWYLRRSPRDLYRHSPREHEGGVNKGLGTSDRWLLCLSTFLVTKFDTSCRTSCCTATTSCNRNPIATSTCTSLVR